MKGDDRLVRALLRDGWVIVPGKKHLKLRSPKGNLLVVGRTQSCHRALRNALSILKRMGYDYSKEVGL